MYLRGALPVVRLVRYNQRQRLRQSHLRVTSDLRAAQLEGLSHSGDISGVSNRRTPSRRAGLRYSLNVGHFTDFGMRPRREACFCHAKETPAGIGNKTRGRLAGAIRPWMPAPAILSDR